MEAAEDPEFCKTDENIHFNNPNINMLTLTNLTCLITPCSASQLACRASKHELVSNKQQQTTAEVFVDKPKKSGYHQGH